MKQAFYLDIRILRELAQDGHAANSFEYLVVAPAKFHLLLRRLLILQSESVREVFGNDIFLGAGTRKRMDGAAAQNDRQISFGLVRQSRRKHC